MEERLRQRLLLTKLTDECRAITTCCQLVDAEWLRSNTQVVAAALAPASVPPPLLDGTEMPVETPRQPLPLYGHWEAEVRGLDIPFSIFHSHLIIFSKSSVKLQIMDID